MALTRCPKCGGNSIYVNTYYAVIISGVQPLMPNKIAAFCNTPHCNQLFWYYPRSRRITLRNTGPQRKFTDFGCCEEPEPEVKPEPEPEPYQQRVLRIVQKARTRLGL